ncbi:MAG: twin-arginine translocation signal domain-containing protein, partial [candidate division WOR-3 bacterium]|nr:twin-arginine translocation signal domain-containing protein [candidate division WOR-3 bacterium]
MNNSRRKFLKNALISGAAIGLSSVPSFSINKEGRIELTESLSEQKKKTKNVVGLACEPIDKVRIGFIGLGMRGPEAVARMMKIEGTEIKALC